MTNKNQQLYVVRGSGYAIDNAMVIVDAVHEVDGERYAAVRPATPRHVGIDSILIHEKYLQTVDNRMKQYVYTFTVTKKPIDGGPAEQDMLIIDGAFRNMAVKTIINRLRSELGPILRLE
jgi:hypothetical protein